MTSRWSRSVPVSSPGTLWTTRSQSGCMLVSALLTRRRVSHEQQAFLLHCCLTSPLSTCCAVFLLSRCDQRTVHIVSHNTTSVRGVSVEASCRHHRQGQRPGVFLAENCLPDVDDLLRASAHLRVVLSFVVYVCLVAGTPDFASSIRRLLGRFPLRQTFEEDV